MKTRLLSMLLSLCMALTMFPAGALPLRRSRSRSSFTHRCSSSVWSTGTAH